MHWMVKGEGTPGRGWGKKCEMMGPPHSPGWLEGRRAWLEGHWGSEGGGVCVPCQEWA